MTQQVAPPPAARARPWLAAAGAALIVAGLAIEGLARRYVVAESAQFVLFAMVAPALIVLGAPWRLQRLSRVLDRLAATRRRQTSFLRAAAFLVVFIGVSAAWRLPPVMDALARHPLLVVPELITLLAAGTALWLELVSSPPLAPRLPTGDG
jgi:cytochrome c oxidase assembly factor CtaG